jgi:hypothetical protein
MSVEEGGADQSIVESDGRDDMRPRNVNVWEGANAVGGKPIDINDCRGENGREEHIRDLGIMAGAISIEGQIVAAKMEDFVEDRAKSEAALRGLKPGTDRLVQVSELLVCRFRTTVMLMQNADEGLMGLDRCEVVNGVALV